MLTPEQLAKSGSEHAHQVALFQWIALEGGVQYPELKWLFAIPNGGDRRPSVAAAMKAEGVKPGVPDLCLPLPKGIYPSLWLEMKRPVLWGTKGGGRSDKQIEWHAMLLTYGHAVVVTYGWKAASRALMDYINKNFRHARDGVVFYHGD